MIRETEVDGVPTLIASTTGPMRALPILLAGTAEQQERWFPDLASGKALAAFALTEAGAGSDAAAARTRATRDDGEWRIDGTKRFISHGNVARIVSASAYDEIAEWYDTWIGPGSMRAVASAALIA